MKASGPARYVLRPYPYPGVGHKGSLDCAVCVFKSSPSLSVAAAAAARTLACDAYTLEPFSFGTAQSTGKNAGYKERERDRLAGEGLSHLQRHKVKRGKRYRETGTKLKRKENGPREGRLQ